VLEILVSGQKLGWLRFLDIKDANKKFAGAQFLKEKTDSPFTGDVVGYVNFDFDIDEEKLTTAIKAALLDFLDVIVYETRGIVSRTDTGYFRNSVQLRNVPLLELFDMDGMNDGDSYLDSDFSSDYMQSIITGAQNLLTENGLANISVRYINTGHNPIRCSDEVPKVHDLSLPVWLFDLDLQKDQNLWILHH